MPRTPRLHSFGSISKKHSPPIDDGKKLYKSARWKRLRLMTFIRDDWTCRMEGCGLNLAHRQSDLHCDHIVPHRGDPQKFFDPDNLQTLCASCHNSIKQKMEKNAS